jgi:RimJ/RimL family protein N-acetyltransferase
VTPSPRSTPIPRWASGWAGCATAPGATPSSTGSRPTRPNTASAFGRSSAGRTLHPDGWGQGYATEAARAALRHGFEDVKLPEIVAFTARANLASQSVMRRIGMSHDPARDFDHPGLAEDHPLRAHVVFVANA